MFTAVEQ